MRLGTAMQIGLQLLREKTDKTKLNRRRAIQSALYFDAFLKQLQGRQPAFCTFFTNHVAAAMHRSGLRHSGTTARSLPER